LAVQTLSALREQNRLSLQSQEYYLKSFSQMQTVFSELPEALSNTLLVAERCRVKLAFGALRLPEFPVPEGFTAETYLSHLAEEGLKSRYPSDTSGTAGDGGVHGQARRRLDKELSIINGMGMAGYFLIAWDLVSFAKREGIPVGPGRGSGVGSIVAYVLGITQVDPLAYGLLFERFLNPERRGLPDLDIDLCHWGRPRVLAYLEERYGRAHVAHLGAFVTLQPRAVIRDVGRALGVSYQKIDQTAKAVPYYTHNIKSALAASPRLQELSRDPEVRTIMEYAHRLQGLPRHMTQHAAGMVITPEPLTSYVALQNAGGENGTSIITQAEMNTVEDLGLLKIDLLGLRYLTVIAETLSFLRKEGIHLSEEEISIDDERTYLALSAGDTIGVFQLESGGMRRLLRRYKPRNFQDIIAILALFRPGPLKSGMVETFIRRRHGEEPVEYLHPALKPVLEETYGIILYQEQAMTVAQVLAGFSLGEADLLRKAITKRDPDALEREKETFIARAEKKGVPSGIAREVFALIQEFGHYGFAKAHSAAYALTSYRSAYLKTHYPVAYHAALLSLNWGVEERFPSYLSETRRKGIRILLPEINRSGILFLPEKEAVRTGLLQVKNLGAKTVKTILRERNKAGPFLSLTDFITRLAGAGLSKRSVENLIKVGAFTAFGRRTQLLFVFQGLWKSAQARAGRRGAPAQGILFRTNAEEERGSGAVLAEYAEEVLLNLEQELLGNFFTKHPLEMIGDKIREAGLAIITAEELREEEKEAEDQVLLCGLIHGVRGHRTKKGERMFFASLEDLTGLVDLVFFPQTVKRLRAWPGQSEPCLVWGKTDRTAEEVSLIVEGVRPLRELSTAEFS
jgi:DNA polymerase-3 subunit alpha